MTSEADKKLVPFFASRAKSRKVLFYVEELVLFYERTPTYYGVRKMHFTKLNFLAGLQSVE